MVRRGRRIHRASHTHKNTPKSNNHGTKIRRQRPQTPQMNHPTRRSSRQQLQLIGRTAIGASGALWTTPHHPQLGGTPHK